MFCGGCHIKRVTIYWWNTAHLQSKCTKSANKSKKIYKKIQYGYQKRKISCWFRIRWKSFEKTHPKTVFSKNVTEICPFSLLLMFVKLVLLVTSFWYIFLQLFQRIRNQREILRFWYFFVFFAKKFFLVHISTFCKLWSQMRKKRLKKSKNVFCKCVLDFNFAPIKGSVFFIFKFVVPYKKKENKITKFLNFLFIWSVYYF